MMDKYFIEGFKIIGQHKVCENVENGCHNCHYHNYDWFDDGDEFEVCEKGHYDEMDEKGICDCWEKL